jgi:hypothetical protein
MFDHMVMKKEFTSSVIYYLTTFWHTKNLCKELYPSGSPHSNGTAQFYDNCAFAYTMYRGSVEAAPQDVFFDYSDM